MNEVQVAVSSTYLVLTLLVRFIAAVPSAVVPGVTPYTPRARQGLYGVFFLEVTLRYRRKRKQSALQHCSLALHF